MRTARQMTNHMIAGHNHLAASGLRALLVTLFKHKLHKQMMCSLKKQNNPSIFNNVCQFDPESVTSSTETCSCHKSKQLRGTAAWCYHNRACKLLSGSSFKCGCLQCVFVLEERLTFQNAFKVCLVFLIFDHATVLVVTTLHTAHEIEGRSQKHIKHNVCAL